MNSIFVCKVIKSATFGFSLDLMCAVDIYRPYVQEVFEKEKHKNILKHFEIWNSLFSLKKVYFSETAENNRLKVVTFICVKLITCEIFENQVSYWHDDNR